MVFGLCLNGVWGGIQIGWQVFKDVAGGLRLLHGFYFGGGVVAYVEAGTRILRLLPYS